MTLCQCLTPLIDSCSKFRLWDSASVCCNRSGPFLWSWHAGKRSRMATIVVTFSIGHFYQFFLCLVNAAVTRICQMWDCEFHIASTHTIILVAEDVNRPFVTKNGSAIERISKCNNTLITQSARFPISLSHTLTWALADGLARARPLRTTIAPCEYPDKKSLEFGHLLAA
jgi:hypothetical protein